MPAFDDEEAFFSLLIASERVSQWLDVIQSGEKPDIKTALQELSKNCQTNEAYAEEVV